MQRLADYLILSPSDLVGFLSCKHLPSLELAAAAGHRVAPKAQPNDVDVAKKYGLRHEAAYLESLRSDGLNIVEIDPTDGRTMDDLRARANETRAALVQGADVVFQATFFDGDQRHDELMWRGHADFLVRVERASTLGSFAYEPEDTKLARRVKASAVLQLCAYAEQLAAIQGVTPENIHVVLGGGAGKVTIRLKDVAAYFRMTRDRFTDAIVRGEFDTYPLPVGHCALCRWDPDCSAQRVADDHLSQVAGLSSIQTRKLEAFGITTMAGLGTAESDHRVPRIGARTLQRLRTQARLQVRRGPDTTTPPPVEFVRDCSESQGFRLLPEPDEGDVFYDIEGDPYIGDGGLEYLHGLSWVEDGELRFWPIWAHDEAAEKAGFERLMDFLVERRLRFPNMHVYHYAPYETSALKRLMGRYATRENSLDELLRGEVFVDLYRIVRQAMVIGSPSYSLKKLEPLYMPKRDGAIVDAGSSIVEYERWLDEPDQQILDDIEQYNRVDVESTFLLRGWLEERRVEAMAGGIDCTRPLPPSPYVPPPTAVELDEIDASLRAQLEATGQPEARLMADLLEWHEREDKPEWWAYFNRLELDDDEMFDDSECIAGLEPFGEPVPEKRSLIWTYQFDPAQEIKLGKGAKVHDPASAFHNLRVDKDDQIPNAQVELLSLDTLRGELTFKRGAGSTAPHPRALVAGRPIGNAQQRKAMQRLGRWIVDQGVDGDGPGFAARQLLGRRLPRVSGHDGAAVTRDGESASDTVVRVGTSLDASYLPVQGPPGAGKTFAGAHLIAELVGQGRTVGITANSHAVIEHLLCEALKLIGSPVLALQKGPGDDDWKPQPGVTAASNEQIEAAVGPDAEERPAIVAGTAWLWSREALLGSIETLIIDEAGQFSLANALAVAPAARNLVLLGDPQQLAQPSKGVHPPGAGASALEHVLAGSATIAPDAGVFLDRTYRMHPDITAFVSEQVYEDRLVSASGCERQRVSGRGELSGTGLRFRPVVHHGNATCSEEEVAEVVDVFNGLLGRTWVGAAGFEVPIGLEDVLVVAPYNAQVNALLAALPGGARVGTVDKFQGQEAPVVIVSMTASSAADIPRGMEFLYSRNRMNVAVSRARALSVLVASPELLAVECHTVQQMRLANVLCRYVEMARGDCQPN